MESSSRKWCNLPSDILLLISQKLDENHDRQLRAVCTFWNSCLPSKPLSNFPLPIPCPIIIPSLHGGGDAEPVFCYSKRFRFYVVETSVILISPLKKETPSAWIAKLQETGLRKFTVFCPLTGLRISPCGCNRRLESRQCVTLLPERINLLDFCVTDITKAYSILWVDKECWYHTHPCSPVELYKYLRIKKLITYHVSAREGIIVLLALRVDDGKLAYWMSGFEEWKMVHSLPPDNSKFVDIICFDAKFCAIDLQGGLIMFDPLTLQPIKSVARAYDNGYDPISTYLVQYEKHLYLVQIEIYEDESADESVNYWDDNVGFSKKYMHCLILTEKGWVFNREFGPKGNGVFFLGKDVTYSVSAKLFDWWRGNFAFYGGMLQDSFNLREKFDLFMNMYTKKDIFEYDNISSEDLDLSGVYDYLDKSYQEFENHPYDCYDGTNIFWPPQEHEWNSDR